MSIKTQINDLYQALERREKDGKLNETGQNVLNGLRSGSIAPAEIGLVLQGASLSSSDEILGYVRGLFDPKMDTIATALNQMGNEQYSPGDVARAMERIPMDEYREENPLSALGLEVGGGILTGGAGVLRSGLASAGREVAKRTATQRAGLASGEGAISGYMAGEGDVDSSERMYGAGLGAGLGLATQGGVDLLGKPIASGYDAMTRSGGQAARQGQRAAEGFIRETIAADGLTPEQAVELILKNQGSGFTLADVGLNSQALMDAIATLPGPGKRTAMDYLNQRQSGRNGRLGTILQDAFGQRANFYNDMQALKAARSSVADKLYGAANKIDVPMSDELIALMQTPAMQDAYAAAIRIAANKGDADAMKLRLLPSGEIVNETGNPVSAINTRFLHFMKMGIDDVAFPKMPQQGIGAEQVNAVRDVRTAYLDFLDFVNPSYARARSIYAGDSAVQNAMLLGRQFMSEDVDELRALVSRMNKSEKEAFRLGVLQKLQDNFDTSVDTANIARDQIKRQRSRDLLRIAFPAGEEGDKKFTIFMDNLLRESHMAVTERAATNSMTAQRREMIHQMRNMASTSTELPTGMTDLVMQNMRRQGSMHDDQRLRAMAGRVAEILTETDPQTLAKIRRDLEGNPDIVTAVQRHAPDLVRNILPFVGESLTSPYAIGSEAGRQGASVAPLNQEQQAIAQ